MGKHASGGDDHLYGGGSGTENTLYGDAFEMHNNASGGVDALVGGDFALNNSLYGDVYIMCARPRRSQRFAASWR